MTDQWILVANGSLARLFSRASAHDPLVALETIDFPEGRQRQAEVGKDRPGHERADHSSAATRFEPLTEPKKKLHERFARQLAERLDDGLADGAYTSLCVLASSPFLGELKAQLSDAVVARLRMAHDADYTGLDVGSLDTRLQALKRPAA